jgi:hypothetical protein
MIDLSQWKQYIVRPALMLLGSTPGIGAALNAPWAINQLVGTTKESGGCEYLVQLDGGPALGFYQMEPATHDDIWRNFLAYQPALAEVVKTACPYGGEGQANEMITEMLYATMMARICYYRSKLQAPLNTALALATYHKVVYNTAAGASVASDDVAYYQQAIDA